MRHFWRWGRLLRQPLRYLWRWWGRFLRQLRPPVIQATVHPDAQVELVAWCSPMNEFQQEAAVVTLHWLLYDYAPNTVSPEATDIVREVDVGDRTFVYEVQWLTTPHIRFWRRWNVHVRLLRIRRNAVRR